MCNGGGKGIGLCRWYVDQQTEARALLSGLNQFNDRERVQSINEIFGAGVTSGGKRTYVSLQTQTLSR